MLQNHKPHNYFLNLWKVNLNYVHNIYFYFLLIQEFYLYHLIRKNQIIIKNLSKQLKKVKEESKLYFELLIKKGIIWLISLLFNICWELMYSIGSCWWGLKIGLKFTLLVRIELIYLSIIILSSENIIWI